ncbi:MAG: ABC transporter permease [Myxococcota bacterium]
MSAAAASTGRFDLSERVGPIVVKEVRQGLRAKVFAIFFGTLLAVCFSMALVAFAGAAEAAGGVGWGRGFFSGYLTALGAVCFFVIPFVAFRSMSRELEDETWVLLTLTGLGAHSITRGKWVSALSQAALFGSACAPFVLFSYFLNGIDLLQIVVALVLSMAWTGFLTALALAIATQAHGKLARTLATFVVLGVLGAGTAGGVAFSWVLGEEGQRLLGRDEFRAFVAGILLFSASLTWLALEASAAGLALPSEPASRGPRIAFTVVSLLGLAFGLVVFVVNDGDKRDAIPAQVISCLFLTFGGAFCISERDGWPRQAASGGWLKPGALRSFALILALLIGSTALWTWLYATARGSSWRGDQTLLAAPAYPLLYLSLAVLAGRLTPLRALGEPTASRVGLIVAIALGTLGSVIASLVFESKPDGRVTNALNPFVGMVHFVERSRHQMTTPLIVLLSATALALLAALVTLKSRDGVRA